MNQDTDIRQHTLTEEADIVQLIIACKMHSDISEKCCENLSILTALLLLDMIFYF